MTHFAIKRIYEPATADDGYRVLVDRLWPRGVSKERAALDEWAKDIAPSTELRKWFGHDPAKYAAFAKRYIDEVQQNPEASDIITNWRTHDKVTLLYGARDEQGNEAIVLQQYLTEK
ncbi:MAG: DUF488 domain-containing protein [Candidatus Saccharimonadales bacterium]